MNYKILVTTLFLASISLATPSIANAQYGQVLASETPEEVEIYHGVKAAGIGDVLNPAAVTGGLLVSTGMYLYFDRKKKASLKDFSFVR